MHLLDDSIRVCIELFNVYPTLGSQAYFFLQIFSNVPNLQTRFRFENIPE